MRVDPAKVPVCGVINIFYWQTFSSQHTKREGSGDLAGRAAAAAARPGEHGRVRAGVFHPAWCPFCFKNLKPFRGFCSVRLGVYPAEAALI